MYLLAVLAVAIGRGELAALATAVLGVLTFNFFYITPRHQLAIAHSHDFVQLIVLLIAAVVVGRLAAVARQRAAEADSRARTAAAREREAKLLAEVASAILAGHSVESQLHSIGARVATATGASHARLTLEPVPSPGADEISVGLNARARRAWLYVAADSSWTADELRAAVRAVRPADRRGDRARPGGASSRRGRRRAARRRRPDGDPARDLSRPALAADRDHDRRLGASRQRRHRGRARRADRRDRERGGYGSPSSSTTCSTCRGSRRARSRRSATGVTCTTSSRRPPGAAANRASDRVRASGRSAADSCRRRAARARVLEPDRERDQVLAAGRAGPDQRRPSRRRW